MKASERQAGFTLIELLIVVVVIGILAAIAIPKYSAARERALLTTAKADLKNLATQEDIYYNDNYTYTSSIDALGFVNSDGVIITFSAANNTGWSASAAHTGVPGQSCSIYHGSASPLTPATVPSVVECSNF